jgi:hypothetical protein
MRGRLHRMCSGCPGLSEFPEHIKELFALLHETGPAALEVFD